MLNNDDDDDDGVSADVLTCRPINDDDEACLSVGCVFEVERSTSFKKLASSFHRRTSTTSEQTTSTRPRNPERQATRYSLPTCLTMCRLQWQCK